MPFYKDGNSSACFHFQSESVADKRDKFAVRGFSLVVIHRIAEEGINGIHLAPVPCHFNGVADSSFHAAGSGVTFLCDGRVQFLRDVPAAAGGFYFQL